MCQPTTLLFATLTAITIGGCTNQDIYNTAQQNHALECQKYPDSRYEECMATVDKDFQTYQREREAVSTETAPGDP